MGIHTSTCCSYSTHGGSSYSTTPTPSNRMTPVARRLLAWICIAWRRLLGLFLLFGPTPQHVAFIMDGNRRFASSNQMDKIGGHRHGYGKMVDVIHWCLELGVSNISVYAFSIDNFKRSPDEVTSLMQLAEDKYRELAKEHGLAERECIEMRVIGDLSLAPAGVQGAAARMMQATASLHHKRAVLNICFSYVATEELVNAVDTLQQAVHQQALHPDDISPSLLDACMRTRDCPPVDLLIRTSGETRLSDFLLWQCRNAQLQFIDCMWPDFRFIDWARCVLRFQRGAVLQRQIRERCSQGEAAAAASSASRTAAKVGVYERCCWRAEGPQADEGSPRQAGSSTGSEVPAAACRPGRGPLPNHAGPTVASRARRVWDAWWGLLVLAWPQLSQSKQPSTTGRWHDTSSQGCTYTRMWDKEGSAGSDSFATSRATAEAEDQGVRQRPNTRVAAFLSAREQEQTEWIERHVCCT